MWLAEHVCTLIAFHTEKFDTGQTNKFNRVTISLGIVTSEILIAFDMGIFY
jgi:hypothetical protein